MSKFLKSKAQDPEDNRTGNAPNVASIVSSVIEDVRANGDTAIRHYSEKFDRWSPPSFKISKQDIQEIISKVPAQVILDIKEVQKNVRAFAEAQRKSLSEFELEIHPGVHLGQKNIPVNSVGAYVPPLVQSLESIYPRTKSESNTEIPFC